MSEPQLLVMSRKRGRRPRYGVRADRRIEFVVTQSQREDLQSVARDERTTMTEVIRQAVDEYVADYREQRVFARR